MHFWTTERGEIAHQLDQVIQRLNNYFKPGDALLVITKNINDERIHDLLLERKDHTIVHVTITGYGGSRIEPGVPSMEVTLAGLNSLIAKGFPPQQIVLRVDPIIPTEEGINIAWSVIRRCPLAVKRIRFSFIDNYKQVNELVGWSSFHAPIDVQRDAAKIIRNRCQTILKDKELEACGEPALDENLGCISYKDYDILGSLNVTIPPEDIRQETLPEELLHGQRKGCRCLYTKQELLSLPKYCPNACVYCYYKLARRMKL